MPTPSVICSDTTHVRKTLSLPATSSLGRDELVESFAAICIARYALQVPQLPLPQGYLTQAEVDALKRRFPHGKGSPCRNRVRHSSASGQDICERTGGSPKRLHSEKGARQEAPSIPSPSQTQHSGPEPHQPLPSAADDEQAVSSSAARDQPEPSRPESPEQQARSHQLPRASAPRQAAVSHEDASQALPGSAEHSQHVPSQAAQGPAVCRLVDPSQLLFSHAGPIDAREWLPPAPERRLWFTDKHLMCVSSSLHRSP
jgi:hypothetical protein